MRIAILGNQGSWYVNALGAAAEQRGHACRRIDFTRLCAAISQSELICRDENPLDADACIVRTMPPGSLEQVVFRMDLLQQLQARGTRVFNSPRAVECAVDKFLTSARLAATGIPTPRTAVCETAEQALEEFHRLGGDVVVKPLFGSEGRGILRVSDPDLSLRVFRTLERIQAVLYLQAFVDHPGYDLRVLVLDGRVLGAVQRSNASDFRTNVARQGIAQPHSPTDEECHLALRSAEAVGADFAGVDLLHNRDGETLVVEVNAVPGWRAFQRATQIDVAAAVIETLERSTNAPR